MLPSARKDGEYTHRGDNHRASVYVLFARQPSSSVGRHALQRARGRPVGGNLMRTSLRWSKRAGAWALVGGGKRSVCAPTRTPSSSSSCRLAPPPRAPFHRARLCRHPPPAPPPPPPNPPRAPPATAHHLLRQIQRPPPARSSPTTRRLHHAAPSASPTPPHAAVDSIGQPPLLPNSDSTQTLPSSPPLTRPARWLPLSAPPPNAFPLPQLTPPSSPPPPPPPHRLHLWCLPPPHLPTSRKSPCSV
ncbi:hypothetical protein DAI22_06g159900 [Oryza sativa Japonica Group]|nr:hypothetical protein DAI22_06g159900 [Oryza sativa Japonica Group]